jgi:hypothetical protein
MDFLGSVVNNLPNAICVIDTLTNKVKYVNDTFSDQLLSRHIIINQSFETHILQETFRKSFLDSFQQAKTTSTDINVGLCKSISFIGNDKCKYL